MPYSFKHVTIYVFDIHPAVSFLREPSQQYLQSSFGFLKTRQAYEDQYALEQPVQTSSFAFKGLSQQERQKSHFWKSFGAINAPNGKPDLWELQMPFVGKYLKADLKVEHAMPGVSVSVVPSIYLSALGWSVNLKIDLEGMIKKSALTDFTGWLSGNSNPSFSFKIGQELKNKKDTFRFFNNLVQEEVYKKEAPPHPGMKIINQLVVSINSYEGEVTKYADLPTDEKALMRSILFGRTIDPLALTTEENTYPVVRTMITTSGTNFALTHFEQGALLFLQREARSPRATKECKRKVACFAANCKNCLMTAYLLWQFYSQSGNQTVASDLGKLKPNLPGTLKSIPDNYDNLFCKTLFQQHKGLSGLK